MLIIQLKKMTSNTLQSQNVQASSVYIRKQLHQFDSSVTLHPACCSAYFVFKNYVLHLHLKQIVGCIIAECARCNFVSFQRAGTVDSVMSNRPFSRPNTSNTLVLPRSVFFCIAQHLGALSHNLVMDAQGHI